MKIGDRYTYTNPGSKYYGMTCTVLSVGFGSGKLTMVMFDNGEIVAITTGRFLEPVADTCVMSSKHDPSPLATAERIYLTHEYARARNKQKELSREDMRHALWRKIPEPYLAVYMNSITWTNDGVVKFAIPQCMPIVVVGLEQDVMFQVLVPDASRYDITELVHADPVLALGMAHFLYKEMYYGGKA